tara:strand:- start:76 stop:285 length:210 start_codon:yes stop_codon:yes gene_type:complete
MEKYYVQALVNSSWEYIHTDNFQDDFTTSTITKEYTDAQAQVILCNFLPASSSLSSLNATDIKKIVVIL